MKYPKIVLFGYPKSLRNGFLIATAFLMLWIIFKYNIFFFHEINIFNTSINLFKFSILLGLPPTGSWQDLKDHMREAGDVCFADVYKDGTGVCEYVRYEDMKYALKKLDDTKFKSHEVIILINTYYN